VFDKLANGQAVMRYSIIGTV